MDDTLEQAIDSEDEAGSTPDQEPQAETSSSSEPVSDSAGEAETAEAETADDDGAGQGLAEEPSHEQPAPAPSDTALPEVAPSKASRPVPWWPFISYLIAWVGVVAAAILTLSADAAALPAIQQEPYPYLILAGLILALIGPLLSVGVWLVLWLRAEKHERPGLLTGALVKGAGVTLLGVLMWWGTLVAVDALRLGMVG